VLLYNLSNNLSFKRESKVEDSGTIIYNIPHELTSYPTIHLMYLLNSLHLSN